MKIATLILGCLMTAPLTASLPEAFQAMTVNSVEQPRGAVETVQGSLYVSDGAQQRVHVYNADGTFRACFGGVDPTAAILNYPGQITANGAGELLVVATDLNGVGVFGLDGSLRFTLGIEAVENPADDPATAQYLYQPTDAEFGPDGDIYVADTGHNRVAVFSGEDGHFLRAWGSLGFRGETVFYLPMGIGIHGDRVYVADAGNGRVMCYDLQGHFIQQYGYRGLGAGEFDSPFDVAVDNSGLLWVVDNGLQKVTVFQPSDGAVQKEYKDASGAAFNDLVSIQASGSGDILVSDGQSGRIYEARTGVPTDAYVKAHSPKAVPGRLADAELAFGPVPARAGEPLVMTLPFQADSVDWELVGMDMRRAAAGESRLVQTAMVPSTGDLASGVYLLRTTVRSEGSARTAIQKIIITR